MGSEAAVSTWSLTLTHNRPQFFLRNFLAIASGLLELLEYAVLCSNFTLLILNQPNLDNI